jgi:hypothetical protein
LRPLPVTLAAAAATAALGGAVASGAAATPHAAAAAARQHVTVSTLSHRFSTRHLSGLRPGWVTFSVKDASKLSHGASLVRLHKGTTAEQALKLILSDAPPPGRIPFTFVGGVPFMSPGESWEGTLRLTRGRYLLLDDGANHKGMLRRFTVSGRPSRARPPATVGSVAMSDFHFAFHLPENWNGRGVLRIPTMGQLHELVLVTGPEATLHRFVRMVRKGYPQGAPPSSLHITAVEGAVTPGETNYVREHLAPGHYYAVCLMPDPKTGKPHTALGMVSDFTVH